MDLSGAGRRRAVSAGPAGRSVHHDRPCDSLHRIRLGPPPAHKAETKVPRPRPSVSSLKNKAGKVFFAIALSSQHSAVSTQHSALSHETCSLGALLSTEHSHSAKLFHG